MTTFQIHEEHLDSIENVHRAVEKQCIEQAAAFCRFIDKGKLPFSENTTLKRFQNVCGPLFWSASPWQEWGRIMLEPSQRAAPQYHKAGYISYAWALLLWAYNGLNIWRLSKSDMDIVIDIANELKDAYVENRETPFDMELAQRGAFDVVLMEYEHPLCVEDDDFYVFAQLYVTKKVAEEPWASGTALEFGISTVDGKFALRLLHHENRDFTWESLNLFTSYIPPLRKSQGRAVTVKKTKRFHSRWVRPKVWLAHESASLSSEKKPRSEIAPMRVGVKLTDEERQRQVRRHYRRGYWGWHAHGPGRSLRKLIWHKPTVVNAHKDVMATHRYSDGKQP